MCSQSPQHIAIARVSSSSSFACGYHGIFIRHTHIACSTDTRALALCSDWRSNQCRRGLSVLSSTWSALALPPPFLRPALPLLRSAVALTGTPLCVVVALCSLPRCRSRKPPSCWPRSRPARARARRRQGTQAHSVAYSSTSARAQRRMPACIACGRDEPVDQHPHALFCHHPPRRLPLASTILLFLSVSPSPTLLHSPLPFVPPRRLLLSAVPSAPLRRMRALLCCLLAPC